MIGGSGGNGSASRLAAIRQKVLGGTPRALDMDVFRPEPASSDGNGERRAPARDPIRITVEFPLFSHRRVVGRGLLLGKRTVRRGLKWLVDPVLDQANAVLNAFQSYFESHEQRLHDLRGSTNAVQARLETYERRCELLEERSRALPSRLDGLAARLDELGAGWDGKLTILRADQGRLNGRLAGLERSLDDHARNVDDARALDQRVAELSDAATQIVALAQQVAELRSGLHERYGRLTELFEHLNVRLEGGPGALPQEFTDLKEKAECLEALKLPERLGRVERSLRRQGGVNAQEVHADEPGSARVPCPPVSHLDLFQFHARFRGSEQLVTERQQKYVALFRSVANVLDIGCGRGEFLELMKAAGVSAHGVDLDPDMVSLCRQKGLDVHLDDALVHLGRLEDGTVGGIFCAQVIEHLKVDELVTLIEQSFRCLRNGGLFVAETLNPGSLAFLEYFYQDPFHVRPFPSETVSFLLESAGFSDLRTEFDHEVGTCERLRDIPVEAKFHRLLHKQFQMENANIALLNKRLFGAREYVIVGRKVWVG